MATCGSCGVVVPTLVLRCADCGAKVPLKLPERIGRYKILGLLGQGTMGMVLRAEHPGLGQEVALKVLRSIFADRWEARERLLLEARAVGRLKHPAIVKLYDAGFTEANLPFFVMELVQGTTLNTHLAAAPRRRLPWREAAELGAKIADALSAAHCAGVIHRDLKPENILLVDSRQPADRAGAGNGRLLTVDAIKILDFSVAKLLDDATSPSITQSGLIVGTPAYMAPEQARGHENLDYRADLYALGVILFEMVCGERPFASGNSVEILQRKVVEPAPAPRSLRPDLPPGLDALIQELLSTSVYGRPGSASAVAETLRAILASGSRREPPAPEPVRPLRAVPPAEEEAPQASRWMRYGTRLAAFFGALGITLATR